MKGFMRLKSRCISRWSDGSGGSIEVCSLKVEY